MGAEHPAPEQLTAFGLGKLAPEQAAAVEEHVAHCDSCSQTLAALGDDTFIAALRRGEPANATMASQASPSLPEVPRALLDHPRYQVLHLIGRGGMGAVYKAQHRLMQRDVALKVISHELVNHPTAAERFQREIRAAARLAHPHIVSAYDAEQIGDLHVLVTEFVEGRTLAELVRDSGTLSVAKACQYIRDAALGLEHAHQHGMVHRDIKPHNLMIDNHGRVKILDFGLAHFVSESTKAEALTLAGSVMGTPDYMALEQARDAHQADIRADIYSLGCTLYYLLVGRPPFPDGSPLEKALAHAQRELPSLAASRTDIPAELEQVFRKMTAKDPSRRYQTPAEVAKALAPLALSETVAARGGTRRKPLLVALAAALLVFIAGGLYVVTDKGRVEIRSHVDDVQIVISRGGKQYKVVDLESGSTVEKLPSGQYAVGLRGTTNDVALDREGFTLRRGQQVVVTVRRRDGRARGASQDISGAAVNFVKNPGFEESIDQEGRQAAYWIAVGKTIATETAPADCYRDQNTHFEGQASGAVAKPKPLVPFAEAGFLQSIQSLPSGERLLLSGEIKTENVTGSASIKLRLPSTGGATFTPFFETPAINGTTDWQRYETVLRVPQGYSAGELALVVQGQGTAWFDEIRLEPYVERPGDAEKFSLRNGDFEQVAGGMPLQWMPIGRGIKGLTFETDAEVKHSGQASATIGNSGDAPQEPWNWRQELTGSLPVGKTVYFTGWVKTKDAGWAGVAVQLLDQDGQMVAFHSTGQENQNFMGSEDWKQFQLRFVVPRSTERMAILAMLSGAGQVWFDDFKMELVEASPSDD